MRLDSFTLPIGTLRSVFRIFPKAFPGYTFRILFLAVLGFFQGLFEGIGITALAPIFYFFDGSRQAPTDFISQAIEKTFSMLQIPFTLPVMLVFIVSLFFLKFITGLVYAYILARIQAGYEQKIKGRLLGSTMQANWSYVLTQKLGKLDTLIKIDSHYSADMLQAIARVLMISATLVAYLLLSVNISKTVTAGAFVFGVVVLVFYKPMFALTRALSKKISDINVVIAHHINESIIGLKTIKALAAEKKVTSHGEHLFKKLRDMQLRLTIFSKTTTDSLEPLNMLFLALIIAFAFYQTSYNLGALAALVYLIHRIFQYIQSVQGIAQNMSTGLPYVENMVSYLEETDAEKEEYFIGKKGENAV